jgi:uncharacterized protein (TIGR00369 family)
MNQVSTTNDEVTLPLEHFDALYGLEVTYATGDRVEARVPVTAKLLQPFGIVHGGVHCAIAEAVASVGTWLGVRDRGQIAMGLSNQTSFLRPVQAGDVILAEAVPIHTGSTTWIWDVMLKDGSGRPCAVSRMTIAVRDPRPDPAT